MAKKKNNLDLLNNQDIQMNQYNNQYPNYNQQPIYQNNNNKIAQQQNVKVYDSNRDNVPTNKKKKPFSFYLFFLIFDILVIVTFLVLIIYSIVKLFI